MKKALIYVRVSTEKQVEGVSLENQEAACHQYAHKHNIAIDRVFRDEGKSAKSLQREGIKQILQYLESNKKLIDYLLVYQIDRASRNVANFFFLKDLLKSYGVEIKDTSSPIETSASSNLVQNINAVIAQHDNELKSERVSDNMKTYTLSGYRMHRAPLGLRNERGLDGKPKLVAIRSISDKIRLLLEEYSTGNYLVSELTDKANRIGLETASGKPFYKQLMYNIIRNPIYAGLEKNAFTDNSYVPSLFKGIISEQTFYKNQRYITLPQNNGRIVKDNEEYPLRRFMSCSECGKSIRGSAPTSRGKRYPLYHCTNSGHGSKKVDDVHEAFVKLLSKLELDDRLEELIRTVIIRTWKNKVKSSIDKSKSIRSHMSKLDSKRFSLIDRLVEGHISAEEKKIYAEKIESEFEEYKHQLDQLESYTALKQSEIEYVFNNMNTISKLWLDGDYQSRSKLQDIIFPKGITYDIKENEFGITSLSPFYRYATLVKTAKNDTESNMVTLPGIEPGLPG